MVIDTVSEDRGAEKLVVHVHVVPAANLDLLRVARCQREWPLAALDAMHEVFIEHVSMTFGRDDDREESIGWIGFVREHEVGPDRWHVEHFDQEKIAAGGQSVERDRPPLCLHARQHIAERAHGILRLRRCRSVGTGLLRVRRGDPSRDQARTNRLEEDALAPVAASDAEIEGLRLGVRPPFDQRRERSLAAQTLRDVIRRSHREDRQRKLAPGEHARCRCDGPVATGGHDQIGMLVENLLGAPFLVDHLNQVMAVTLEQRSNLLDRRTVAGVLVVKECNSHMYLSALRFNFRAELWSAGSLHVRSHADPRLE